MTPVDPARIAVHVRSLGAMLKTQFDALEPVIEPADMLATFHAIDGAAEASLRAALRAEYPQIGWSDGEFRGTEGWDGDRAEYWVCDALDGAVQYLRAIPSFCISLSLLRGRSPAVSVIFDPLRDELYVASSGRGATLNGRPIHANTRRSTEHVFLATSHPPFVGKQPRAVVQASKALAAILPSAIALRNFGPTSLQIAYVACGRLDGFYEFGEDGFNCVGASLVAREAGAVVTDVLGADYDARSSSILVAPASLHAPLLLELAASVQ